MGLLGSLADRYVLRRAPDQKFLETSYLRGHVTSLCNHTPNKVAQQMCTRRGERCIDDLTTPLGDLGRGTPESGHLRGYITFPY